VVIALLFANRDITILAGPAFRAYAYARSDAGTVVIASPKDVIDALAAVFVPSSLPVDLIVIVVHAGAERQVGVLDIDVGAIGDQIILLRGILARALELHDACAILPLVCRRVPNTESPPTLVGILERNVEFDFSKHSRFSMHWRPVHS
jgi:hypothetical protein